MENELELESLQVLFPVLHGQQGKHKLKQNRKSDITESLFSQGITVVQIRLSDKMLR